MKKTKKKKPIDYTNKPLTSRQKKFIQEYIKTGNATQSVLAAGYNCKDTKSAGVVASRMLNNVRVKKEIDKAYAKLDKNTVATAQEVMEFFTKVMNGEILDQFGLEAPLAERTKAAIELAKRTVDLDNRVKGKADATLEIKLNWDRDD